MQYSCQLPAPYLLVTHIVFYLFCCAIKFYYLVVETYYVFIDVALSKVGCVRLHVPPVLIYIL